MANLQNNIYGDDSLHVCKEEYIVIKIPQILSAVYGIYCIPIASTKPGKPLKPEIFYQFGAMFKFCSNGVNASVI